VLPDPSELVQGVMAFLLLTVPLLVVVGLAVWVKRSAKRRDYPEARIERLEASLLEDMTRSADNAVLTRSYGTAEILIHRGPAGKVCTAFSHACSRRTCLRHLHRRGPRRPHGRADGPSEQYCDTFMRWRSGTAPTATGSPPLNFLDERAAWAVVPSTWRATGGDGPRPADPLASAPCEPVVTVPPTSTTT